MGYIGTKHFLKKDELWAGLVGCLGLTFGLLMETTLLIIRTNRPQPLHERYPELFDKKIWGKGGMGPMAAAAAIMGKTGRVNPAVKQPDRDVQQPAKSIGPGINQGK